MSDKARDWITGGCQCGEVRYRIDPSRVLTLYCCHCYSCQAQASSAFGMSMKLPREAFELRAGSLARWQRVADSGRINRASFCPRCGCRIYHDRGEGSAIVSLKAGSLDERDELRPVGHIWIARAQGWLRPQLAGLCYEHQPPDYAELERAFRDLG